MQNVCYFRFRANFAKPLLAQFYFRIWRIAPADWLFKCSKFAISLTGLLARVKKVAFF